MDPTEHEATRFCSSCGTLAGREARFCEQCGFQLVGTPFPKPEESPQPDSPGAWPYSFPSFAGEKVLYESRSGVEVKWLRFNFDSERYEPPSLPHLTSKILVTNQRIVLLDRHNNLVRKEVVLIDLPKIVIDERLEEKKVYETHRFPMSGGNVPLSPFWVLKRTANEELYKEFMQNPRVFSKVPGAWWVHGYRGWSWVERVCIGRNNDLELTLTAVRSLSQWGPGRQVPSTYPEGVVGLQLAQAAESKKLEEVIKGLVESGPPFREEFLTSIPHKPETTAYTAYTYVFWVGVAEVIPLGILLGAAAPPWLIFAVSLAVGWLTVLMVKRWRSRILRRIQNRE